MRVVTKWICPACQLRLTLFVPPHGPPQCPHNGRRALKPVAMIPDEPPEPPEAA